ncbi:sigma factor-like helix-turn-helix DNA-binding protein [uncultured Oscillibacter sp.]|uniref:RNA polymerase sigma factor n=1 Tax=uncultured Oscillibacter sp. TaxID=876091 RepID=UPI002804D48E|nr:sigma factor-like helix-turn-helix DNA-binding protein [uncultured Oscillibacter sp.]
MSTVYQFPYDSPVRYLPLVYMLPLDLLSRFPTLRRLPRSMGALNASPEWAEVILSDAFLNEAMDAVASLAFPYFGFGGWKEHYTGFSPVWRLSYALPLWAKGVEQVRGWGVQALFALPPDFEIPFFDPEDVRGVMKQVVEQAIEEQGWGPVLEVVREIPCDEDFEKWDTNVRRDFLRKWYHSRSKRVQTVSLEVCMEDEGSSIHSLPAPEGDFTERVEAEDFCQRFKATLSEKDMAILELRVEGYTYEEIADRLGYKTHSGVIKRMEAVKKQFIQYEEEAGR